uniref:35 kDa protein n=1 Tax=Rice virus X TaxID=106518 RepID=Q9IR22_9TOMB|nr:35 kDa protein [Rice virus X]
MYPLDLVALIKRVQAWSPEKLFTWLWDVSARCVRAFVRWFWKAVDYTGASRIIEHSFFEKTLPHVMEAEYNLRLLDQMEARNNAFRMASNVKTDGDSDSESSDEEDDEELLRKNLERDIFADLLKDAKEQYKSHLEETRELEIIQARVKADNEEAARIESRYNHHKAVDDCLEVLVYEANEAKNLQQISYLKSGKYDKCVKTVRPGCSVALIKSAIDMIRSRHMVPDSSFNRIDEAAIRATALDFAASFNMDAKTTHIVVTGVVGICCLPDPKDIENIKVAYHPKALQMRDLVSDLRASLPSFTPADF